MDKEVVMSEKKVKSRQAKTEPPLPDDEITKRLRGVEDGDKITVCYRESMPGVRQEPLVRSMLKIRVADTHFFDDFDPDNDVNPPLHRIFTRGTYHLHHKRIADSHDPEGFHLVWCVEQKGVHIDQVQQVTKVVVKKGRRSAKKKKKSAKKK